MRVFSYKIVRDYGFAPNPFKGICTLATCKPQIRKQAVPGDLIIGCGSSELQLIGKSLFAMRVSEKLTFSEYWNDARFEVKKPSFTSSYRRAYGDNIYEKLNDQWIQQDSHHSLVGGVVNVANLQRDTSADAVLIGEDFVYWGAQAIQIPHELRDFNGDDLYPSGRSHRSVFKPDFVEAIDAWFQGIQRRGVQGRPKSWR